MQSNQINIDFSLSITSEKNKNLEGPPIDDVAVTTSSALYKFVSPYLMYNENYYLAISSWATESP